MLLRLSLASLYALLCYVATAESAPVKRLGLFSCLGWGPGCTNMQYSNTGHSGAAESRRTDNYEPLFTLTSGMSWAPAGKRSSSSSSIGSRFSKREPQDKLAKDTLYFIISQLAKEYRILDRNSRTLTKKNTRDILFGYRDQLPYKR